MALKKFAFIAEGDVFMIMTFPEDHQKSEVWTAGLLSAPTIVDVSSVENIAPGWTWNGTDFINPGE